MLNRAAQYVPLLAGFMRHDVALGLCTAEACTLVALPQG